MGNNSKTFGLELAGGAKNGLFASGQLGRVDADGTSEHATLGGATAGYSIPVQRAEICPLVGYSHTWFPDVDDGSGNTIQSRVNTYQVGASLGTSVPLTTSVSLTPFVSAAYVHLVGSASTVVSGATLSASTTKNYGDFAGGVGLVFNRLVTAQVSANVPAGLDDVDPTFTVGLAFNFWPH